MATKKTAVALPDDDEPRFPVLAQPVDQLLAIVAENLGGETITDRDLDAIRMPAGGGTMWEVPSLDGTQGVANLEGVVVQHYLRRAYWPSREVTNSPPQCSSPNSKDGYGDPGDGLGNDGACLHCPYAEFGTALNQDGSKGAGQACKQMRQVFLLQGDSLLPRVVTLPPTSLGNSKTYFLRLAQSARPYYGVISRLVLERQQGPSGPYSVAHWSMVDELTPEEKAKLAEYRDELLPLMAARSVRASDVQTA